MKCATRFVMFLIVLLASARTSAQSTCTFDIDATWSPTTVQLGETFETASRFPESQWYTDAEGDYFVCISPARGKRRCGGSYIMYARQADGSFAMQGPIVCTGSETMDLSRVPDTTPVIDMKDEADGRRIFRDTPNNWAIWTEAMDLHVQDERAGDRPPGIDTWEAHWRDVLERVGAYENPQKYVDYIIAARRKAGLPELTR